jgi:hypothetical protein
MIQIAPISRLRLSRRQMLKLILPLAAWMPAPMLMAAATGKLPPALSSFTAFLDQLIPEDEWSPSASQAGVDAAIIADAQDDKELARVIELGVAWLDAEARKRGAEAFHQMSNKRQMLLVSVAERHRRGTVPRVFFANLRTQAFHHYYADPQTWAALGYAGPPQPRGFMDYQKPLSKEEYR